MPDSLWQAVQQETEKGTAKNTSQANRVGTKKRPYERSNERSNDRTNVPAPVRAKQRPVERPTVRRAYDFYRDQVLWLRQVQLDIEKRYGRRVSANAMVQLAVDWLASDHHRNRAQSKLIRELVLQADPQVPTSERTSGAKGPR